MTHYQYDLILRGGTVVTPDGIERADLAIAGESIVAVSPELEGSTAEAIDARELHVLPGAVDVHVHFNEPGRTSWEGWATGSAACAVGGTTTVAEMPLNAHPPTVDGPSFDAKRAAAEHTSFVDFALWGGLTPLNLDRMEELAERGVIGFKAFMSNSGIDDFPAADDATLLAGMRRAAELGIPVAVHAENDGITATLAAQAIARGATGARDYLSSRPAIAEIEAIARAILFAAETGCALHVVHVSTGQGIAQIAAARVRGLDVTAETCPHYLLFDQEDLEQLGAIAKCAPPLRPRSEVGSLWHALINGDIHIVASDHSPAPAEMKSGDDFFRIWGGISGCQSLLSSLLSAGHIDRDVSLPVIATLLAEGPATRFRLASKGRIAPGNDADLVLVDLAAPFTLRHDDLRYRHQHSPFAGMIFAARPRRTILRGETVALDGQIVGAARGQLIRPDRP
ncbi:MAG: allantoinase AllB, partial [Chloroflexia bacterium]|nr:allantoinase AllB [Chloroflexia bacterium]